MDPISIHIESSISVPKRSLLQRILPKCFQSSEKTERAAERALGKVPSSPVESPVVHVNPTSQQPPLLLPSTVGTMVAETKELTEERRFLEHLVSEFGGLSKDERVGKKPNSDEADTAVLALNKAIQDKNVESIRTLLQSLPPRVAMEVIPHVLLGLTESSDGHQLLVAQLREVYPGIERYIISSDSGPILSPEGINAIVKYLQAHGSLIKDCTVCKDIQTFEEALNGIKSSPDDCRRCFIVRYSGNHVTPVYLEKTGDQYRCVITDSIADRGEGEGGYYKNIYGSLYDVLQNNKLNTEDQLNQFKVFTSIICRQHDQTNCPIFSLRDVVHLSQKGHELIGRLEPLEKTMSEHGNMFRFLFPFVSLPSPMMMSTQSVQMVRGHDSTVSPEESVYVRLKSKGYLKMVPTDEADKMKEINTFINQRALKYERILITAVIGLMLRPVEPPHDNG